MGNQSHKSVPSVWQNYYMMEATMILMKTPSEIIQAVHLWHRGDLTAGTLAARLGLDPVKLLGMFEVNGVCDYTGRLDFPDNPNYTLQVLLLHLLHMCMTRIVLLERHLKQAHGYSPKTKKAGG